MKVSVIIGTRPEAIKLSPVVLALKKYSSIDCQVCVTAQHREMLDQVLRVFDIVPDTDLDLMQPNQTLTSFTILALEALDRYVEDEKPDLIIVQGDTTTVFVATLVAFYHNIPVAHVEAGLRTGDLKSPWPEEANRVLTSHLAELHFAPTETNKLNLLKEGIPAKKIGVTGNTVIDALCLALERVKREPAPILGLDNSLIESNDTQLILITAHRRENFGRRLESICRAILQLSEMFSEVHFVYPVHLNPKVRSVVMKVLDKKRPNVHLIEPLSYLGFVKLMNRSTIVLTDSGGIQEEAPSLGKPVLVLRDTSERPEAIEAGTARLVGTAPERIIEEVRVLLTNEEVYKTMSIMKNPYGDGKAAERIVKAIVNRFIRF